MGDGPVTIADQDHLRTWLNKELSPLCEAELSTLVSYIFALLKKPNKTAAQLKEFCAGQLEVFLHNHTRPFVDKLFTVLDNDSYIPKSKPAPPAKPAAAHKPTEAPAKAAPAPKAGTSSSSAASTSHSDRPRRGKENKRSEPEELTRRAGLLCCHLLLPPNVSCPQRLLKWKRKGRKPKPTTSAEPAASESAGRSLRKRISAPSPDESRTRNRSPPAGQRRDDRRTTRRRSPEKSRKRSRSRSRSRSNERMREERNRRKRCRDYDQNGFCMRGNSCPYDHGPDPVVVDSVDGLKHLGDKGLKIPVTGPPPNFSVPPPGFLPLGQQPPPPGIVEGYNPDHPQINIDFSHPPPPIAMPGAGQWRQQPQVTYIPTSIAQLEQQQQQAQNSMGDNQSFGGPMRRGRGFFGGRGGLRGRGRGGAGGRFQEPVSTQGRCLEVRNIPIELNTIDKLNAHFAQFGKIANLQVQYQGESQAALVTFFTKFEANNAYKSPDPIFNNRFIKVFWHNDAPPAAADSGSAEENKPGAGSASSAKIEASAATRSSVQAPKKPPVATRAQAVFRNADFDELMRKKAAEKQERTQMKTQLAKLQALQKSQTEGIDRYLKSQKAAMELAKKQTKPDAKKKALKLCSDLKNKIDILRKERNDNIAEIASLKDKLAPQSAPLKEENGAGDDGKLKEEELDYSDEPIAGTA
ncbi:unnamed protein product, partial [Mesorhabditis spiculigera]